MGNFCLLFFYTKPPEKIFFQKFKIKGTQNTFGKFQSILEAKFSRNEDLKTIYNVKFLLRNPLTVFTTAAMESCGGLMLRVQAIYHDFSNTAILKLLYSLIPLEISLALGDRKPYSGPSLKIIWFKKQFFKKNS